MSGPVRVEVHWQHGNVAVDGSSTFMVSSGCVAGGEQKAVPESGAGEAGFAAICFQGRVTAQLFSKQLAQVLFNWVTRGTCCVLPPHVIPETSMVPTKPRTWQGGGQGLC